MQSTALTALFVATMMTIGAGCSDGNGTLTGGAGSGGGAAGSTGSGGGCVATGGATGAAGTGGSTYTHVAVCGQRGQATATATTYTGWEEFFMTSDEGLGDDICVVRFDVKRSGAAPGGCTECSWTQTVEYSNPTVVTDTSGACANSDLGLTAAKIASISGSRLSVGFVREWQGAHGSVRFRYFENTCDWDVYGSATWDDPGTDMFRYDHRDGFCNY